MSPVHCWIRKGLTTLEVRHRGSHLLGHLQWMQAMFLRDFLLSVLPHREHTHRPSRKAYTLCFQLSRREAGLTTLPWPPDNQGEEGWVVCVCIGGGGRRGGLPVEPRPWPHEPRTAGSWVSGPLQWELDVRCPWGALRGAPQTSESMGASNSPHFPTVGWTPVCNGITHISGG